MIDTNHIAAIIVAAGTGARMGEGTPKQFRQLAGRPVVAWGVEAFRKAGISTILLIINPAHREEYAELFRELGQVTLVEGGARRQDSVRHGLEALAEAHPHISHVLIHDAARPGVGGELLQRLVVALGQHEAVVPVVPVADTLKIIKEQNIIGTYERSALVAAQTPQAFSLLKILAAHRQLAEQEFTDDAALFEALGWEVTTIPGEAQNSKLTTPEDWQRMEARMGSSNIKIGFGKDVHRLLPFGADVPEDNRTVRMGGIDIPHSHYLEGFSDADVVLHAVVDALLGALGKGDIGQHFPPGEPRWKGADSAIFIVETLRLMREAGAAIHHLDITITCEAPKIGPYRTAMRHRIAMLLGVEEERVNMKATTTEGLGFTGRGEGVMAEAVVTVRG